MKIMTYVGSIASLVIVLSGCGSGKDDQKIIFATCADYPPFEYFHDGQIKGFDIDVARAVAHEMGKEAVFQDMQFSGVLASLDCGHVDAAISTITVTPEREKSFDFSDAYYVESMATVYKDGAGITTQAALSGKNIACQLGSTMEIWLKQYVADACITAMDNNNQAIEALKAGHVDVVLLDGAQGALFSKKNPGLAYAIIAQPDTGYALAFKKGSALRDQVNQALKVLRERGVIKSIEEAWFKGAA